MLFLISKTLCEILFKLKVTGTFGAILNVRTLKPSKYLPPPLPPPLLYAFQQKSDITKIIDIRF